MAVAHFSNTAYADMLQGRAKHGPLSLLNAYIAALWGGETCAVADRKVAAHLGVTPRTIQNWRRRLKDSGIIQVAWEIGRVCVVRILDIRKKRTMTYERNSDVRPLRINGARASDSEKELSKRASPSNGPEQIRKEAQMNREAAATRDPQEVAEIAALDRTLPLGQYFNAREQIVKRYRKAGKL